MMTDLTRNELTVDQRAYLDTLARAGGDWKRMRARWALDAPLSFREYAQLRDLKFIQMRDTLGGNWVEERITTRGYHFWRGQTPAEPDELARLREQVAALTAERDALVQAAQAVIADCEAVRVEPIHLQALRAAVYRVSNE